MSEWGCLDPSVWRQYMDLSGTRSCLDQYMDLSGSIHGSVWYMDLSG